MGKIVPNNKKGGVVTTVILGVGGLIIAVIVALLIISTLDDANLIGNDSPAYTTSVINESVTFGAVNAQQALKVAGTKYVTCNAITTAHNQTTTGAKLGLGNLTQSGCYVINATTLIDEPMFNNGTVYVSYTYTTTVTSMKDSVGNITNNFTSGINNVSLKVPTILLIVAVVFLFGVLVLLLRNVKSMGVFGSGAQGGL